MSDAISSPSATASWTADVGRAVRLFRAFRTEQTDPDRFYGTLAEDSVGLVGAYADPRGATVLDVGGGLGYFAEAFHKAGSTYYLVDSDLDELNALGEPAAGTVLGSGMALPIGDEQIDICFSSNVLEHVADPWRMADEMVRVTKPGGTIFLSYTGWWGLHGGHETAPWHFLGGHRAARRYERRHGHAPKNRYGESLFPITVASGLRWARDCVDAKLVAAFPRYHPRWAYGVLAVPGLREFATWNLILVLRRR
ncbi:class I SAM-dependent methyltransferase [Kribbella qitaiheensis]|uniref:Class I SAM-dependent methyltransferase n=1 Tax=Kribbella qitaiheensis TaxID=1544730 RepID=A0A7G6X7U4_9ACTN|nr:class I SAM-dependent methyltransferase [Kribbella qitaiheensis]QNE22309.1 class I SAM-dependent methyltransferase [Kribbella qitaiheensis]